MLRLLTRVDLRSQRSAWSSNRLQAHLQELLKVANGNWTESILDGGLQHCCMAGCCKNELHSKERCWNAIVAIIFSRRPQIPALSRWTSCTPATRWFMLASVFHGLLSAAWAALFAKNTDKSSTQNQPDVGLDALLAAPADERELYSRTVRVRSQKATNFVTATTVRRDLALALTCCSPSEHLFFTMFSEQSKRLWLNDDMTSDWPIVRMVHPTRSPVVRCIHELFALLQGGMIVLLSEDERPESHVLVFLVLTVLTQIWRRLLLPFQGPSESMLFKMALMLDHTRTHEDKLAAATAFLEVRPCCLGQGDARVLHSLVHDE